MPLAPIIPTFFASSKVVGEVADDDVVAKGLGDVSCLKYFAADIDLGGVSEVYVALCDVDTAAFLEIVKLLYAVSGLAGASLRLSRHPILFLAQQVVDAVQFGGHGADTFGTSAQEVVVIAVVSVYMCTVYLNNFAAHSVQEIAVVSHHQQRHTSFGQICFKPFDSSDIQVVGRFVQYQKLGLGGYGSCHGYAFALSAGHLGQRYRCVVDAQSGQ